GFQSRLWASDGLIKKFSKAKFNQFHIHSDEKREAVVLRDTKPLNRRVCLTTPNCDLDLTDRKV
ncbi:MAG: hypothetical protein P8P84_11790, partial [Paracoccaceae bacterium]|nr:hypothetical protein [Paracoccaceae bacterium]